MDVKRESCRISSLVSVDTKYDMALVPSLYMIMYVLKGPMKPGEEMAVNERGNPIVAARGERKVWCFDTHWRL